MCDRARPIGENAPSAIRHPNCHIHIFRIINTEHVNGRAADRRPCLHQLAIPKEVVRPQVLTRMEQAHDFSTRWISPWDIRALVRVAVEASESEIVFGPLSSMVARDNVIDLKVQLVEILGHLAILTSTAIRHCAKLSQRSWKRWTT